MSVTVIVVTAESMRHPYFSIVSETMRRRMTRLAAIYSMLSNLVSRVRCLVWYVIR